MTPTIENIVRSKNKVMRVMCTNGRTFTGYIYMTADSFEEVYIEESPKDLYIATLNQIVSIEEAER